MSGLQLYRIPSRLLSEMWEFFGDSALFEQRLRFDFRCFDLNKLVVLWQIPQSGKDTNGLSLFVVVHEPSWRERHEEHSSAEQDRGYKLQAKRKQPRSVFLPYASPTDMVLLLCSALPNFQTLRSLGSREPTVPKSIQKLIIIPRVIESCCNPTSAPRTSGGAISALYMGTIIDREPTPIPRIEILG